MTDTAEVIPLNEDEREQLAALQYRQAMEDWQQGEDKRLAELAMVAPVIAALGDAEQLDGRIKELAEAAIGLDRELQQSVERIVSILSYDGRALVARHSSLSQPAPKPIGEAVDMTEPAQE